MKKLHCGKTKDVFIWEKNLLLLRFKDSITGTGGQADPGGNEVIGRVTGKGNASLRLSVHFFELLEQAGIPTHYLRLGPAENSLLVKRARSYCLEVICREKAWGSFLRRYGAYIAAGELLPSLVEFTLKDDRRGDPPITEEALAALNIASPEEINYMKQCARRATALIKKHLASKSLELIDIKYEFGATAGQILVIDEISGDSMRVFHDKRILLPDELVSFVLD